MKNMWQQSTVQHRELLTRKLEGMQLSEGEDAILFMNAVTNRSVTGRWLRRFLANYLHQPAFIELIADRFALHHKVFTPQSHEGYHNLHDHSVAFSDGFIAHIWRDETLTV